MKYQDLFSLKNKKMKILASHLLQILLGALRVKVSKYLDKHCSISQGHFLHGGYHF